jgi:hypothetical protein
MDHQHFRAARSWACTSPASSTDPGMGWIDGVSNLFGSDQASETYVPRPVAGDARVDRRPPGQGLQRPGRHDRQQALRGDARGRASATRAATRPAQIQARMQRVRRPRADALGEPAVDAAAQRRVDGLLRRPVFLRHRPARATAARSRTASASTSPRCRPRCTAS